MDGRSEHGVFGAGQQRWQVGTSLTAQTPRTKTDIAHFCHIVVAGCGRMHDNLAL
jgi:hypothetical protein